jgi:ABC-type spermidine/putrescine transport system permease subunit I
VAPAVLILGLFYVVPVVILLSRSLFDPEFTLEHYARIFNQSVYLEVLWITFEISFIVTVLTLVFGYALAYVIYRASNRVRLILLAFVLLPFWTSLIVRTFTFIILLQREGVVNDVLLSMGLISEPLQMVYNRTGVLIGMTYMLLPYMVLSIFSVLDRIDPIFQRVAVGMGASRLRAFVSTVLPLSLPGVFVGSSLVFLLSLGYFITPALLGGRTDQMIAMVIEDQVNVTLNWGFASALSATLLVATALFGILLAGVGWIVRKRMNLGQA